MKRLTLRYGQKTKKDKAILVGTSSIVVDASDGEIYWPIFCVSSSNGNCCFIATEDDGYEHGPMCHGVFSDHILQILISVDIRTCITKRLPHAAMPNCLTWSHGIDGYYLHHTPGKVRCRKYSWSRCLIVYCGQEGVDYETKQYAPHSSTRGLQAAEVSHHRSWGQMIARGRGLRQ